MSDPIPKNIVGITQRIDSIAGHAELRDALDQRLVQWLTFAGFLPVAIPNTILGIDDLSETIFENWLKAIKPNALVLSGGNDIGEYPERDTTEQYLLSWAEANNIPVLGICRGLQMMATWTGTSLSRVEGHVGTRHRLVVTKQVDEWPENVNSYHNWSIASCPDRFKVMARDEYGSIEAIQHLELPWEAWMWHPEREEQFSHQDTKRLKKIFAQFK